METPDEISPQGPCAQLRIYHSRLLTDLGLARIPVILRPSHGPSHGGTREFSVSTIHERTSAPIGWMQENPFRPDKCAVLVLTASGKRFERGYPFPARWPGGGDLQLAPSILLSEPSSHLSRSLLRLDHFRFLFFNSRCEFSWLDPTFRIVI